ncbi:methyltransferase domain-containing protein [Brevundimonas sp. 2R-24]|uniref:Methyltransferase domain-containing protein n=1 Tax=Peiella sedimenti TaxID=3061083 RepID=A0ABT8SKB8_9CAUL|nr:methyltransferase domain-containing protein [Caulobacteraceae bacterium XZ-24]
MAFNLEHQQSPVWVERATTAVELLQAVPLEGTLRIADVGCGDGKLKIALGALDRPWTWAGFDLLPQDVLVQQFDITTDYLPDQAFDVAVCLGVLEYIEAPAAALERLSARVPLVLFSYSFPHSDEPVPEWVEPRRGRDDIIRCIRDARLERCAMSACTEGQIELSLCRRKAE